MDDFEAAPKRPEPSPAPSASPVPSTKAPIKPALAQPTQPTQPDPDANLTPELKAQKALLTAFFDDQIKAKPALPYYCSGFRGGMKADQVPVNMKNVVDYKILEYAQDEYTTIWVVKVIAGLQFTGTWYVNIHQRPGTQDEFCIYAMANNPNVTRQDA